MVRFSTCAWLLFILALATAPARASSGETGTATPVAGTTLDSRQKLEQQAFYLINRYRKENRMPSLRWDDAIAKVARVHSRDMATGEVDFGHGGFGERVSQLKTVMIGLMGAGENVFETNDPHQVAQSAVEIWLKSPPHLHNIRGDYNYSGLGAWENGNGTVYFTQIFVKIQPRAQEAQIPSMQTALPLGLVAQPYARGGP